MGRHFWHRHVPSNTQQPPKQQQQQQQPTITTPSQHQHQQHQQQDFSSSASLSYHRQAGSQPPPPSSSSSQQHQHQHQPMVTPLQNDHPPSHPLNRSSNSSKPQQQYYQRHPSNGQRQQPAAWSPSPSSVNNLSSSMPSSMTGSSSAAAATAAAQSSWQNAAASYISPSNHQSSSCYPVQWTPEAVASLPPPGLGGPTQIVFAPNSSRYLAYVSVSTTTTTTTNNSNASPHQQSSRQKQQHHHNRQSSLHTVASTPQHQTLSSSLYRPLTQPPSAPNHNNSSNRHYPFPGLVNGSATTATSTAPSKSTTTTTTSTDRILLCLDLESKDKKPQPLLRWVTNSNSSGSGGGSNVSTATGTLGPNGITASTNANNSSAVAAAAAAVASSTATMPRSSSKRRIVDPTHHHHDGNSSNNVDSNNNTNINHRYHPFETSLLSRNSNNNNSTTARPLKAASTSSSSSSLMEDSRIQQQQQQRRDKRQTSAAPSSSSSSSSSASKGSNNKTTTTTTSPASPGSLTHFSWTWCFPQASDNINDQQQNEDTNAGSTMSSPSSHGWLRILAPARGSLYVQDGLPPFASSSSSSSRGRSQPFYSSKRSSSNSNNSAVRLASTSSSLSYLSSSSSSSSSQQQQQSSSSLLTSSSSMSSSSTSSSLLSWPASSTYPSGTTITGMYRIHDKNQPTRTSTASTTPVSTTATAKTSSSPPQFSTTTTSMPAMDAQLSPDGSMVAWTANGEIYVQAAVAAVTTTTPSPPATTTTSSSSTSSSHHHDHARDNNNTSDHINTPPLPLGAVQITHGAHHPSNRNTMHNHQGSNNNNNSNASSPSSSIPPPCIRYGVAEFVAQEEMDRYRGYWWHPDSNGILLTMTDESIIPVYRIVHQDTSTSVQIATTTANSDGNNARSGTAAAVPSSSPTSTTATTGNSNQQQQQYHQPKVAAATTAVSSGWTGAAMYEDHRYPFAGKENPTVRLGFVKIDRASILQESEQQQQQQQQTLHDGEQQQRRRRRRRRQQQQQSAGNGESVVGMDSSDDDDDEEGLDTEDNDDDDDHNTDDDFDDDRMQVMTAHEIARENWDECMWYEPPPEAPEYLARVYWLPDGSALTQWQNRKQTCSVLYRMDLLASAATRVHAASTTMTAAATSSLWDRNTQDNPRPTHAGRTLLLETRDGAWINLHHMFYALSRPVHPDECVPSTGVAVGARMLDEQEQQPSLRQNIPPFMPNPLPPGSTSFLFASERTGYSHLYLYTYCPGFNDDHAVLIRAVTAGEWMVESIAGVDEDKDIVYFTGTYDSVLERHLYAAPIVGHGGVGLGVRRRHSTSTGMSAIVASIDEEPSLQQQQHPHLSGSYLSPTDEYNHSANFNSGGGGHSGVRRGLSKVMHALSGKGGRGGRLTQDNEAVWPVTPHRPLRITVESGMHSIVMDDHCRFFVDTSSDLNRPTSVKIYELLPSGSFSTAASGANGSKSRVSLFLTLYDAAQDERSMAAALKASPTSSSIRDPVERLSNSLPAPELISFPTSDGTETLHAALYRPDPRIHGPGPYPLVCAVYGGPHVQRVNRSWSQCADMRAQRLRSLGFCVVKCDNRGSSRRGLAFESAIAGRLGRLEVLDQVMTVRQLILRGIADPDRVGVYGWSYGGYLSVMCLCRAPDVFHVAVAGAPVTSWDGYDTHYTERYMGLPMDNPAGYRESAVFDHVPNMRGRLMIVHGLIDENVHFRHTARLINKLIASGKDYDLLIFPEERHSPRRLRDRIYMEQRISEYFIRHLAVNTSPTALDLLTSMTSSNSKSHAGTTTAAAAVANAAQLHSSRNGGGDGNVNNDGRTLRTMAGHL